MDAYLSNTKVTIDALKRLESEYENYKKSTDSELSQEAYLEMRGRCVKYTNIRWVKHIYNCSNTTQESDPRYDFLSLNSPVVLPVIIQRLEKLYESWNDSKNEKVRNKWRKQCKDNWDKALDNRSHNFKITEK